MTYFFIKLNVNSIQKDKKACLRQDSNSQPSKLMHQKVCFHPKIPISFVAFTCQWVKKGFSLYNVIGNL